YYSGHLLCYRRELVMDAKFASDVLGAENTMGQLDGKVALITGAARGQGRSHAVRLAREGASIIGIDVPRPLETVGYPMGTADDLAETARAVEAEGQRMLVFECDVRDGRGMNDAVNAGVAQL